MCQLLRTLNFRQRVVLLIPMDRAKSFSVRPDSTYLLYSSSDVRGIFFSSLAFFSPTLTSISFKVSLVMQLEELKITALSATFLSSLMLPGQEYPFRHYRASFSTIGGTIFSALLFLSTNLLKMAGMSSSLSLRGGM